MAKRYVRKLLWRRNVSRLFRHARKVSCTRSSISPSVLCSKNRYTASKWRPNSVFPDTRSPAHQRSSSARSSSLITGEDTPKPACRCGRLPAQPSGSPRTGPRTVRRWSGRAECPERERDRHHHPGMTLRFRPRVFHITPYIAALLGHVAAAYPSSGAAASPKTPVPARAGTSPPTARNEQGISTVPTLQLQVICGKPEENLSLQATSVKQARFTLHADGDLDVADPIPAETSFSFTGFTGGAIARIEVVSSDPPQVWCSAIEAGKIYAFPTPTPPADGKLLLVQLFT